MLPSHQPAPSASESLSTSAGSSSILSSAPSSHTPDASDVEEATLAHCSPTSIENTEFGDESERPTYEDEVAEELGGDHDLEAAGDDYADDEGADGEEEALEEGLEKDSGDVFDDGEVALDWSVASHFCSLMCRSSI